MDATISMHEMIFVIPHADLCGFQIERSRGMADAAGDTLFLHIAKEQHQKKYYFHIIDLLYSLQITF